MKADLRCYLENIDLISITPIHLSRFWICISRLSVNAPYTFYSLVNTYLRQERWLEIHKEGNQIKEVKREWESEQGTGEPALLKCFTGLLNSRASAISDNPYLRLGLPGTQANTATEPPGRFPELASVKRSTEERVRGAEGRSETESYYLPSYRPKLFLQRKAG